MKKILAFFIVVTLIMEIAVPVSAQNVDNNTVLGTYSTEEEKQELINGILESDSGALIFTSQEEYEEFLYSIQNPAVVFSELPSISTYGFDDVETKTYCISFTTSFFNRVNFYYSYQVRASRSFVSQVGSPTLTYTGYTLDTSASLVSSNISKISSQKLDIKFTVNYKYYIILEGIGQVGAQDISYHYINDLLIGHYVA